MTIKTEEKYTDILIIGGGVSGLTAAYRLCRPGTSVTLICDGSGASPYITGFDIPFLPGDSPELMARDAAVSGRGQADGELLRTLCEGSAEAMAFLKEIDFPFDMKDGRYDARRPVGASFPRVIGHKNVSGAVIQSLLTRRLEKTPSVSFIRGRALRLLTTDGRAAGALCYDRESDTLVTLRAAGVILACGGFCGLYGFSTNTADIGGDGPALAYYAGAVLNDLEFVQFEPSAAVWPESIRGKGMITTLFYEGAVLRNGMGERFMTRYSPDAERVNKDVLGLCIAGEISAGRGTPHGGVWFDASGVDKDRMHGSYEYFVKRYRDAGIDLCEEPVELAPAPHTSLGGVAIRPDGSTAIRGLFACGEAAGNVHGANRIGGMAGLETMVFGLKAGEAAADYLGSAEKADALRPPEDPPGTSSRGSGEALSPEDLDAVRARIGCLLDRHAGLIRCEEGLKAAAAELRERLETVSRRPLSGEAALAAKHLGLENDLTTALLLILACLERKESVGCHTRSDSPKETAAPYRIDIRRGAGGPVLTRIPLG